MWFVRGSLWQAHGMRLRIILAIALVTGGATGCAPSLDVNCKSGADCADGQMCAVGQCIARAADGSVRADSGGTGGATADTGSTGGAVLDARSPVLDGPPPDGTVPPDQGLAKRDTGMRGDALPPADALTPTDTGGTGDVMVDATIVPLADGGLPPDAFVPSLDAFIPPPPADAYVPQPDAFVWVCPPAPGTPVPPEACDDIDQDCDGNPSTVGHLPIVQACYSGPPNTAGIGACHAGTQHCAGGVFSPCVGEIVPSAEICDGVDNDCNGSVDESPNDHTLKLVVACYDADVATLEFSPCTPGFQRCNDGALGPCVDQVLPANEICDGFDNNCDGVVDGSPNGLLDCQACAPGSAQTCYSGPADTAGVGLCLSGIQICADNGSGWGRCTEEILPTSEICNGLDDDCNGVADDNIVGQGAACTVGVGACAVGGVVTCDDTGAMACDAVALEPGLEICDGVDNNCNGQVDEGFDIGVTCTVGVGICAATGINVCDVDGGVVCSAQAGLPGDEDCNGLDDNCNGQIDETNLGTPLSRTCFDGPGTRNVGQCRPGTQTCADGAWGNCQNQVVATVESCDGVDNNCNGQIDDAATPCDCAFGETQHCYDGPAGTENRGVCVGGTRTCNALGHWGGCVGETVPGVEMCNNNRRDDDCDGTVDNVPGTGGACSAGQGACLVPGTFVCDPSTGFPGCNAVAGNPSNEICDRIDNDCDGIVDNGFAAAGPCDTGLPGVCAPGHTSCDGGQSCEPNVPPSAEVCDGLDNDCDGIVDNNTREAGGPCATGQPGVCAVGATICVDGHLDCQSTATPEAEICDVLDNNCDGVIDEDVRNACGRCGALPPESCNGLDDNCDGQVDNDAPCPDGQACRYGHCINACANNECNGAQVCVAGFCAEPCDLITCEAGQICVAGTCADPCANVTCAAGQICVYPGECVADNCFAAGCTAGERCVNFVCEPDPCAETQCDAGQFCRDGRCISSCAAVACPLGESCLDGACIADPCAGRTCPDGQACRDGACAVDPCQGVTCDPGLACVDGVCGDDPCHNVHCAPNERCEVLQGLAQCVADWGPETPVGQPDGGVGDAGGASDAGAGMDTGPIFVGGDAVVPLTNSDGGTHQIAQDSSSTSGCGCRVGGNTNGSPYLLLLALGTIPGLRRRRR